MKKQQLLCALCAAVFVACGSKSPAPTTPDPGAPVTDAGTDPDDHAGHVPDAAPTPSDEPPPPDPAQATAELLAAENAAFEKAKPVFDKFCASCHTQGARGAKKKTLDHFDMTKYPFTGHHAGELTATIRKVLGIGGGKPTMPRNNPGAVQGDDLALIGAWADAFDASHAGGAHKGMSGHEDHGARGGDHKH